MEAAEGGTDEPEADLALGFQELIETSIDRGSV